MTPGWKTVLEVVRWASDALYQLRLARMARTAADIRVHLPYATNAVESVLLCVGAPAPASAEDCDRQAHDALAGLFPRRSASTF